MSRSRLCATAATIVLLWSASAAAQESASRAGGRGVLGAELRALLSYQPKGYDGTGGPYLDNSLGGTVPGFAVTVERSIGKRWSIGAELSTTSALKATQSGRFVVGGGPVVATHRDTLVSLLSGLRVPVGGAAVELKGGISAALGEPRQGDSPVPGDTGRFGLTAGIDGIVRLGTHVEMVPSFRYTHVWRGENALYVGLGDDILRAGLGVRIWLVREEPGD